MKWTKSSNFVPNFLQRKNEIGAKKKSVHLQSNKTLKVMIRIQSLVFKVINVLLGEGTVTPFFLDSYLVKSYKWMAVSENWKFI